METSLEHKSSEIKKAWAIAEKKTILQTELY